MLRDLVYSPPSPYVIEFRCKLTLCRVATIASCRLMRESAMEGGLFVWLLKLDKVPIEFFCGGNFVSKRRKKKKMKERKKEKKKKEKKRKENEC